MNLTNEAKEAARYLVEAWDNSVIGQMITLLDVTVGDDNTPRLDILQGVLKSEEFELPPLPIWLELRDENLIKMTEEVISRGSKNWEVRLTQRLRDEVNAGFASHQTMNRDNHFMERIFISYSTEQRNFRTEVERKLRRAYDSVWSDERLYGGEDWWAEILEQITQCNIFIYLLSPESLKSKYCRAEYAEAFRLQKQIIPVMITPDMPVPGFISSRQAVLMREGINAETITNLFAAIIRLTKRIQPESLLPRWDRQTPLPDRPLNLNVPAEKEPRERELELCTGFLLLPEDKITISAEGRITVDEGQSWMTPDGIHNDPFRPGSPRRVTPSNTYKAKGTPDPKPGEEDWGPVGSLFGWVGEGGYDNGKAFYVGNEMNAKESKDEGFLFLAVNDTKGCYTDNRNSFEVKLEISWG